MTRLCKCGAELSRRNTTGRCNDCKVPTNKLEIPADWFELAATTFNDDAIVRWGVSRGTIQNWRKATGIKAPRPLRPPVNTKKTPPEFAEWARTMNLQQMADRAGMSKTTARRMCAELGVEPFRPAPQPKQRKQNMLLVMQNMGKRNVAAAQVAPTNRDMSLAGRAADFLQKRGPIFRCDFLGRFKLGGTHWKWRGMPLRAEEVIAEAQRLGFDPDAWKRIGAAA